MKKNHSHLNGRLLRKVSENLKILESKYEPFKHWLFDDALPKETINELLKLPLQSKQNYNIKVVLSPSTQNHDP